ncbi:MAG: FAD-binding oxidoreductase, partial [Albidovulum sp.]
MEMPTPDPTILGQKNAMVSMLHRVLPADAVIDDPAETLAYECDGLTAYRCVPLAVVLPRTTAEVAAVLKLC